MGGTHVLERQASASTAAATWWWLAIPALVAAVVNGWRFDATPFWRDEAWTAATSAMPFHAMVRHLAVDDAGLGGYYALMRLWMLVGSDSTWWLRVPGLVASVLTAVLVGLLARRLAGVAAGVAAGVLITVMPVMVEHAQEVRPYPLVVAAACATALALHRYVEDPTTRRWRWWAAAAAIASVLHPMVGLPAVLALAAAAYVTPGRAPRTALLAGSVVPGLSGVAVVLIGPQQAWRAGAATVSDLARMRHNYGAGALAVLMLVVLVVLAVVQLRRDRQALWLLASWAAVPPAVLWAYGVLANHYQPRYLAAAAHPVAILAGIGCTAAGDMIARWVGRPRVAPIVAGVLVAVAIAAQASFVVTSRTAPFYGDDPRSAAQSIVTSAHPGDAVVYLGTPTRPMMHRYLPGGAVDDALLIAAPPTNASPWGIEYPDDLVRSELDGRPRVWVVGTLEGTLWPQTPRTATVLEAAGTGRTAASTREFGRVRVQLWAAGR